MAFLTFFADSARFVDIGLPKERFCRFTIHRCPANLKKVLDLIRVDLPRVILINVSKNSMHFLD